MKRKRATAEVLSESPILASQRSAPAPLIVLQEMFDLLEDYAPFWYTEELRDRAISALSGMQPKRLNLK